MAAVGAPVTSTLGGTYVPLSFDIEKKPELKAPGADAHGIVKHDLGDGSAIFRLNVNFKAEAVGGAVDAQFVRSMGLQVRAKSLKEALTIIEAFGREMEFINKNDDAFNLIKGKYLNRNFCVSVKFTNDPTAKKVATVTFFKPTDGGGLKVHLWKKEVYAGRPEARVELDDPKVMKAIKALCKGASSIANQVAQAPNQTGGATLVMNRVPDQEVVPPVPPNQGT